MTANSINLGISFARWLVLMILFTNYLVAQKSSPDSIIAFPIDYNIKIDAMFDEPCWSQAMMISNFQQRELHNGMPVTEPTKVALAYNSNSIYIAVWCYDSEPDKITAKEMKYDFQYWYDDNFEIAFDTYNDNQNGYIFVINPNGAKSDLLVSGDGAKSNRDWNGVWNTKVRIDSSGWFAEIEIPFSTLKFPNSDEQVWGVNFERNIRRKQEAAFWQGWSRNYDFEHVSQAGTLIGLKGIKSSNNIEIKPSIVYGANLSQFSSPSSTTKISADMAYSITPATKINLTVNTDFAQAESDRIQVNFTKYSLFYPEKRDFFLEGVDLFDFTLPGNLPIFYSRRIGINDQTREQVPIIAGLKTNLNIADTRIGVMSIATNDTKSTPKALNTVIRATHYLNNNVSFGGIITSYRTNADDAFTYGLDLKYQTPNLFSGNKFIAGIQFAQVFNADSALSQDNIAYSIYANFPNELFSFDASYSKVNKDFNPSLGFSQRSNYHRLYFNTKYKPRTNSELFNRLVFSPIDATLYFANRTNQLESADISFIPFAFTNNDGDYFQLSLSRNFDKFDADIAIMPKIIIPTGDYWCTRYSLYYQSFAGRYLSASISHSGGEFYHGNRYDFATTIAYSASKHFMISAEYSLYLIRLNQQSHVIHNPALRLQYALSPDFNVSLFSQFNSMDKQVLSNFRLQFIPSAGSILYLVINSDINKRQLHRYSNESSTILFKYTHRISL